MPSTVRIVCLARALRGFGDGFATIVLPIYLTRIGYDPIQIGFVLTSTLLGTALFTLIIGVIAPRFDLRTLMIFGAALMTFTGLAFPAFQDFALSEAVLEDWGGPRMAAVKAVVHVIWSVSR